MGDVDIVQHRRAGIEGAGPVAPLPDDPPPDPDGDHAPPDPISLSAPSFDAEGRLCWTAPPQQDR